MKKNFSFLIFLLFFFCPASKSTASDGAFFQLAPVSQAVAEGELFSLEIRLNSGGEKIDTARAVIKFDSDILQVDSFVLGKILPNNSPGNYLDNQQGIISCGGFTLAEPFSGEDVFAVINFSAKKIGETTIEFSDNSRTISNGLEKINTAGLNQAKIIVNKAAAVVGSNQLLITSTTHPDQNSRYQNNNVDLAWNVLPSASGYYWGLDQNLAGEVSSEITGQSKRFSGLTDGIWYFHLKAKLTDGSFTAAAVYRLQIDSHSPEYLNPYLENQEIKFGAIDKTSGMDHYNVRINGAEWTAASSPLALKGLLADSYFLQVKAVDRAGNEAIKSLDFNIKSEQLSAEKPTGRLAAVKIFFQNKGGLLSLVIFSFLGLIVIVSFVLISKNKYKQ